MFETDERPVEKCWGIKTQFPIAVSTFLSELRIPAMTLSYADYEMLSNTFDEERAAAYNEHREPLFVNTMSSYSYEDGSATFMFRTTAQAREALEALRRTGAAR